MDIRKDMQNFSSHIMREYGESVLFNNHKPVDLRHAELFKAWQAAKAQAVLEGFVLVPMEPTELMIRSACGSDDVNEMALLEQQYKQMIEAAQEPANADTNS